MPHISRLVADKSIGMFWVVTPFRLVGCYRRFGNTSHILAMKKEAKRSSESLTFQI
jgi:hypothetical protein